VLVLGVLVFRVVIFCTGFLSRGEGACRNLSGVGAPHIVVLTELLVYFIYIYIYIYLIKVIIRFTHNGMSSLK
jgi:hypothetical protein